MADYDIGDIARITGTFIVDGTNTDPTTVSLEVTSPTAASATTYTYAAGQITKSATGIYYYDLSLTLAGAWLWRWVATGAVASAESGYIYVRSMPTDYSSLEEVTAFTRHLLDGQSSFNTTTRPTRTEVVRFLGRLNDYLNIALIGQGLAVPITAAYAKGACDDWVTARAAEYVELTQRGVGYSEGEGSRVVTFRNLHKAANDFAKENHLAFVRAGVTQDYKLSSGLEFTALDAADQRSDPHDTSLAQPKFKRGLFDEPGGSGYLSSDDEDEDE